MLVIRMPLVVSLSFSLSASLRGGFLVSVSTVTVTDPLFLRPFFSPRRYSKRARFSYAFLVPEPSTSPDCNILSNIVPVYPSSMCNTLAERHNCSTNIILAWS